MTRSGGRLLDRVLGPMSGRFEEPVLSVGAVGYGWTLLADVAGEDHSVLAELLAYQSTFSESLGAKGEAAYFIDSYSRSLALAAAPLVLVAGVVPNLAADRLAMRLEPRTMAFAGGSARVRRLHLRFLDACVWSDDPQWAGMTDVRTVGDRDALLAHLRATIETHFGPLIHRVRAVTNLSQGAQWRLVADAFAAVFLEIGQSVGRARQAQREAMIVLKHPGSPLNNPQLHFFELECADASAGCVTRRTFRARGGCCRFYTAKGGHLCSTCVLRDPASRDAMLRASMRG